MLTASHSTEDMQFKAWRKIALALFKREFHVLTMRQRELVRTACEAVCDSLAKHKRGRRFAELSEEEKEAILLSVGGGRQQPFFLNKVWQSMSGEKP